MLNPSEPSGSDVRESSRRARWRHRLSPRRVLLMCIAWGGASVGFTAGPPGYPAATHDFPEFSDAKVELGRNLMFDKILSGNRNISCGTCHHSLAGTGDGLSLPVGEGGAGLGVTRSIGFGRDAVHERVPRNAPPVFNLGDRSFHTMFHDGRVSTVGGDRFPSGCDTPAGMDLPDTLESVLACQAMFPVTSAAEMAGQPGENRIADAAAIGHLAGPGGVWDLLAQRLRAVPAYVALFADAFPNEIFSAADITFAHAANAIAAFESNRWRCDQSPFDQYVRGDRHALSQNTKDGMRLFYKGRGGSQTCAGCHSGLYQTDQQFHAIAMPQIGAGRGSNGPGRIDGVEDFGREMATLDPNDRLMFRTPTLRNVAVTAPYGHSGAYNRLRAVVEHHLDPVASLRAYNRNRQAVLPTHPFLDALNYAAMDDPAVIDYIADHNQLEPMAYREDDVDRIIDFLHALTDPACLDLRDDFNVETGVASGSVLAD